MIPKRRIARDAARLWRLSCVNRMPDPARVRRIADALVGSRRAGRLAVLATFLRLLRRDHVQHSAAVASAAPLDAGTRAAIAAGLARRYRRPMDTTFAVDPGLIGGIRLTAASDVFDDSVRARLAALEQQA